MVVPAQKNTLRRSNRNTTTPPPPRLTQRRKRKADDASIDDDEPVTCDDDDEEDDDDGTTYPEEKILSSSGDDEEDLEEEEEEEEPDTNVIVSSNRRKVPIKYIQNKTRRHVTFAKRRHGIMKKAYELSVLTGANILLLILSNSGLVYTFATPKLEPMIRGNEGKNLIKTYLNRLEESTPTPSTTT